MTYKFVNADQLDADLTTVADAIRTKGNTSEQLEFPSGMVTAIGAISAGEELNFEIKAYATEAELLAATPKENTIGVVGKTITSWIFSVTEPENPVEGMAWCLIGTSSDVAFNALKKNGIQIFLLGVQMYTNGVFEDADAWVFQNNSWIALAYFDGLIYDAGTFYTEHKSLIVSSEDDGSITYNASYIQTTSTGVYELYEVFGPFKLDDFNTLNATGKNTYTAGHIFAVLVDKTDSATRTNNEAITEKEIKSSNGNVTISLDVSNLAGEYYVYAGFNSEGDAKSAARPSQISKVWLEV